MNWKEKLHDYLLEFLDTRETAIYLELLTEDKAVSQIKTKVSIKRTTVYSLLESLKKNGLVHEKGGSPTLYAANNPISFIEGHIKVEEKKLNVLKNFKEFTINEVLPNLPKDRKQTLVAIKNAFYIDNHTDLLNKILDALLTASHRVIIRCPLSFIQEINDELSRIIKKLAKTKDDYEFWIQPALKPFIRLIVIKDSESINVKSYENLKPYFQVVDDHCSPLIAVINDKTFIFNYNPEGHLTLNDGTGIILEDKLIADSYHHHLGHVFQENFYNSLPESNIEDISEVNISNDAIKNVFSQLFREKFKIDPLESYDSLNYYEFLSNSKKLYYSIRNLGIQYKNLSKLKKEKLTKRILEEHLQQSYTEGKTKFLNELKKIDIVTMRIEEQKETRERINHYDCLVLRVKISIKRSKKAEMNQKQKIKSEVTIKTQTITYTLVAFLLELDRIFVVWSSDKKHLDIIKSLSDKIFY